MNLDGDSSQTHQNKTKKHKPVNITGFHDRLKMMDKQYKNEIKIKILHVNEVQSDQEKWNMMQKITKELRRILTKKSLKKSKVMQF